MKNTSFNPAKYAEISKRAFAIANEMNAKSKKEVNAAFDQAIKEAGYTKAYVAKMMRMFGQPM